MMRMRYGRWCTVATLVVVLTACSSKSEPEKAASPRVVAVTAIGAPVGAAVQATIGRAGGTVASADGKITLVVPADTVSEATEFSVTPVEVTSPGGIVAYRLSPDGATFANNVTVSFRYSDADVAGSHPSLLRVAYQDAERRWRQPAVTLDESSKTVSVQTTHFSDWSLVRGMQIRPASAVVTVKESVQLTVQHCNPYKGPEDGDDELYPPVHKCTEYPDDVTPIVSATSVNGIVGGNASVGRVTGGATFHYIAPSKVPSPDTVTVSVETKFRGQDGKMGKTILLAQVKVVPEHKTAPADSLPQKYSGSGNISRKSGGEGAMMSLLNFSATYEIAGGRSEGSAVGEYTLVGTLKVTEGQMDLPNCKCSITGGSAPAEAGLGIGEADKIQSLAVSSFVPVSISCTPTEGRKSCPSTSVIPIMWANNPNPQCPGSTVTTYSNVRELAGGYQRTCGSLQETANWTLIGE